MVGYAGGTVLFPTYESIGDHTEVCQVTYDPEVLPYSKLLEFFWSQHNPSRNDTSYRQYMTGVWYHNDEQMLEVTRQATEVAERIGAPVQTVMAPLTPFYRGEEYHQNYYAKMGMGRSNY
eukprot:SAG11_NODE_24_length_24699_cov_10.132195_2_plen_120_part_00